MVKHFPVVHLALLLMLFCAGSRTLHAQQPSATDASDTKLNDIVKETQKSVGGKDSAGLVWWLPTEFWEQSAIQQGSTPEQAKTSFAPLREYTMIIVAVGKVGIGNINWYSENEVRSNTSLRDADGHTYQPLTEISSDAKGIASIVKPVLSNILGPTGQNLQVLFFPARTSKGKLIADPRQVGGFFVRISNLTAQKDSDYEWRLPLTSLSPPKFCPAGKERVEANWKFCPWHGNRLDETPSAAPGVESKKQEEKPQS